MKKVFVIINILLLSLMFFEGWLIFRVLSTDSILSFRGDKTVGKSDKKKDARQGGALSGIKFEGEGEKLLPLRESFAGIIEKNLFHTQRREGADEVKVEPSSPSQSKPIIIEGIIIFKNYRAAVIKDTASQVKGGRPTRRVRVGDVIEDQAVIAIMEDRIIVKNGDGEKVIKLHASDKPQRPQIIEKPEAAPAQDMPAERPPSPS